MGSTKKQKGQGEKRLREGERETDTERHRENLIKLLNQKHMVTDNM